MPALLLLLGTLLAIGFLSVLLFTARKGRPFADDGSTFTLRHSALLRWFSLVALVGGETLFALWVSIKPPMDDRTAWLFGAGAALLGLLGLALLWESYTWRLTVTPAALDCRSPWKSRRIVPRDAVASVRYSRANGWYVLRFTGGGSFRVPAVVPGVQRFLAAFPSPGHSG